MHDIFKLLNDNSGALNAVFCLIVALATAVYAILTFNLVAETKRMRAAQTDPHIAVRIEPSESWINLMMLIIENVGAGPAYDVHFTTNPDFEMDGRQPLSQLGVFKYGIPYMAPGQRISHFLISLVDAGPEIEKPDGRFRFTVQASYKNALGSPQKHEYPIDFLHLIGLSTIGRPPLEQMADELERIRKSLGNLESGWRRLNVDLFTAQDRAEERRQHEERRQARLLASSGQASSVPNEAVNVNTDNLTSDIPETKQASDV